MKETKRDPAHRVVVLGGGFAGLACARALDRGPVDVLLVDRHNYHLFTPLLYQVATSLLNPSDISYPFRSIFRRSPNVRFRQATAASVDLERHVVRAATGEGFGYDSLVVATGSENNYFASRDLATHTVGMKTLAEATGLRNHVLACLELAARSVTEDERRAWLTFVVAGGGPTGVEYAGALAELLRMVLGRDFPELSASAGRIVLVEGQDHLLGGFHPKLGGYAARTLEAFGVEIRTGVLVQKAAEGSVLLSDGEHIDTHTVVWSAGVRPTDPLPVEATGRRRSRRVEVDAHLRLPGHPEVHVIGDAAAVDHAGHELPMLSPPAMQAGRYVARAILARAAGRPEPPEPFRYRDKGTMATVGRRAAVADVHGLKVKGTVGWLAWLLVHIYYLIGFRNRAVVLASWGWNYLRKDRPIRLILRSRGDPAAAIVEPEAGPPT